MKNDVVILKKVSEGDEKAFRNLFEYYYPKVKAFLSNFIDNNADAEDLAQNIFVKIWLQRSILSEIRSFGAYLYTTTRNTAIDFGRVRKIRIPLTDENSADVATEYQSEHEFFAKETELQIAAVISKLPEKRRQVFIMSRMEGKTNGEIADIMGITKKTVENHLNLVLKELRKITTAIAIFI